MGGYFYNHLFYLCKKRKVGGKVENRKYTKTNAKYESLEFDFKKFMNNPYGLSGLENPILENSLLKNLTSSPQKYDRDEIRDLIKNPALNEKALKDFAQYLYNTNMFFKRLIHYFADILDFRFILKSSNPEPSKKFINAYHSANDWFDKFNIVHEFRKVMKVIILEDVAFYYLRENDGVATLQRMPSDYCKITGSTNLGYTYAINMTYFMQTGVNIADYPEEIQLRYMEYQNGGNPQASFYITLDPTKAVVFKWDENYAGIVPVLLGTFLMALDIVEFQDLQRTRTQLDTIKLLMQKIPMRNDKDAKKNDFLIDEVVAGAFHTNIKNSLPAGTNVITTPMDVDAINFNNVQDRNNIVAEGEQSFWGSAGVSPLLFGASSKSSVGVLQGLKIDSAFVDLMYHQFARFVNCQLDKKNKKYKFKIDFLGSTIFNKEEQFDQAMTGAAVGMPVSLIGHAIGLQPRDLNNLTEMEDILKIKEKLTPLQSTHTSSSDGKNGDNGGRPEKKTEELTDSGLQTKDEEQNSR